MITTRAHVGSRGFVDHVAHEGHVGNFFCAFALVSHTHFS